MPFGKRVMEAGIMNESERLVEELVVVFGYAGTAPPSFNQTNPQSADGGLLTLSGFHEITH